MNIATINKANHFFIIYTPFLYLQASIIQHIFEFMVEYVIQSEQIKPCRPKSKAPVLVLDKDSVLLSSESLSSTLSYHVA